jgi:hypothetical protein
VAQGFRRTKSGIGGRFAAAERAVLVELFDQVYELLATDSDDSSTRTDDGGDHPRQLTPTQQQAQDLAALVGIGTATVAPADPALARLLPDAHRDDPELSADFRRYTELGLRARKQAGLRVARDCFAADGAADATVNLNPDQAAALAVALTDVRLVLAARIGLEGGVTELPPDQLTYFADVYDFLAWLQESLVAALMPT